MGTEYRLEEYRQIETRILDLDRRILTIYSGTIVAAGALLAVAAPKLIGSDAQSWLYELELDGFRAVAQVDTAGAAIVSGNGHRFRAFDELRAELARIVRPQTVVDGELVVLDRRGRSDFDALFYRRGTTYYVAFDVLVVNGEDVRHRPLLERKRLLGALLGRRRGRVRYLAHVRGRGVGLFALVCAEDLEGIVAKRADSRYADDRAPWVKIKNARYGGAVGRWQRFERA